MENNKTNNMVLLIKQEKEKNEELKKAFDNENIRYEERFDDVERSNVNSEIIAIFVKKEDFNRAENILKIFEDKTTPKSRFITKIIFAFIFGIIIWVVVSGVDFIAILIKNMLMNLKN